MYSIAVTQLYMVLICQKYAALRRIFEPIRIEYRRYVSCIGSNVSRYVSYRIIVTIHNRRADDNGMRFVQQMSPDSAARRMRPPPVCTCLSYKVQLLPSVYERTFQARSAVTPQAARRMYPRATAPPGPRRRARYRLMYWDAQLI